jgi:uncharacterized protein (TIGR02118 family)
MSNTASDKKETIMRVSIYYPSHDGSTFDADYYLSSHMPLVREKLGSALLRDEVWRGAGEGSSPAPYEVVLHMHCADAESFNAAFAPHAKVLTADIPNYTNITPVIQLEETLV